MIAVAVVFSNEIILFLELKSAENSKFISHKILKIILSWAIVSFDSSLLWDRFWGIFLFSWRKEIVFVTHFCVQFWSHQSLWNFLFVIRHAWTQRKWQIKRIVVSRNLFNSFKKFWKEFMQWQSFVILKTTFVSYVETFWVSIRSSQSWSWLSETPVTFSTIEIFIHKIFCKFWCKISPFFDH